MYNVIETLTDQSKMLPRAVEIPYHPYMVFFDQCQVHIFFPVDAEHSCFEPYKLKKILLEHKALTSRGWIAKAYLKPSPYSVLGVERAAGSAAHDIFIFLYFALYVGFILHVYFTAPY